MAQSLSLSQELSIYRHVQESMFPGRPNFTVARDDLADWVARARKLENVLIVAVEELERLRYLHLPQYEGKTGEPDLDVINLIKGILGIANENEE